jgi:uncharacterized membrane protein
VYNTSFPKPVPFTMAFIAENNTGILTTTLYNVTVKGLTTKTLVRQKYAVPLTLTCRNIQTFYIALIPKENIYVCYFRTYNFLLVQMHKHKLVTRNQHSTHHLFISNDFEVFTLLGCYAALTGR